MAESSLEQKILIWFDLFLFRSFIYLLQCVLSIIYAYSIEEFAKVLKINADMEPGTGFLNALREILSYEKIWLTDLTKL